jgi:hypothetical protein
MALSNNYYEHEKHEKYEKAKNDYLSVSCGSFAGTTSYPPSVLTTEIMQSAIDSLRNTPSSYEYMKRERIRQNEEYNRRMEMQRCQTQPSYWADRYYGEAPRTMQEIRINERDFVGGMRFGVDLGGSYCSPVVKPRIAPHKIQLLKYRIKYLLLRHPHLKSLYDMHDLRGMDAEAEYKFLKSKI